MTSGSKAKTSGVSRILLANRLSRLSCRVRGEHFPKRGTNGWQNSGTGVFCQVCGLEMPLESLNQ